MSDRRPHLYAVDSETGELFEQDCPDCLDKDDLIAGLERSLGKLERQIREMNRDREAERMEDPDRQAILSVIERWKKATGHPNARNSDDRFDMVKARLREKYTIEQLELAVDGLGAFPYVVNGQRVAEGKSSQRHDRMGIALGGGEAVERFANLGHQARRDG